MFPNESIPDGDVLAPHHLYLGALATLLVVWMVSDDRPGGEAWLVASAVLTAMVGFLFTWRYYPPVGAALTLAGLVVAMTAVLVRPYWAKYSWVSLRGAAVLALLVALDDALEHALGWPTPLDLFWKHWLYGVVSSL